MTNRLQFIWNRINEMFWVRPLTMVGLSIGLVFLANLADSSGLADFAPDISAETIDSLLTIIASSMLGIATFSVASMISAYASASKTIRITTLLSSLMLSTLTAQDSIIEKNIPENLTIHTEAIESDKAIKERLDIIFDQIEELNMVVVEVASGVVTLSGTVPITKASEEAVALTKKVSGVIYVRDRLKLNVEVSTRLRPAIEQIHELRVKGLQQLPIVGIALLVIMVFWLFGNWLSNRKSWYKHMRINDLSSHLLRRFVRLIMIGIGIFFALEILDATALAGAILGVAGIAGIALGFAFRNIVENYLAGILLSMRNPFSTGDAVEIDGFKGKVIRLTSRDTVLMTFDGNHLRIPNSRIITSVLTNFTRNPLRRIDFAIGISVELDLVSVMKLGISTLRSLPSVLENPQPAIVVEELGDSTVNLRFFAWIDQRDSDYVKTKSEAIRLVKEAFDEANIEMPEPTYRVQLREAGQSPITSATENKSSFSESSLKGDSVEALDTSADTTIDDQLEAAQASDEEPNLLEEK